MNTTRFNKCVQEQADALLRFVVGIVHDLENARDITQESFTRLWEHRQTVVQGSEKSYLFTIAYNLAISSYRNQARHPQTSIENYCTSSLSSSACYDDTAEILWRELDKLPPISRTLIMLCDWEGYSYNEIAQITNLSPAQVKIGLYRARQTIKEKLNVLHDEQQR